MYSIISKCRQSLLNASTIDDAYVGVNRGTHERTFNNLFGTTQESHK